MLATYGLIVVPTVFFIINVAVQLHVSVVVLSSATCFLLLVLFSAAACSDPGVVFLTTQPDTGTISPSHAQVPVPTNEVDVEEGAGGRVQAPDSPSEDSDPEPHHSNPVDSGGGAANGYIECGQCHIDRPRTATHCYDCGVCIDEVSCRVVVCTIFICSLLLQHAWYHSFIHSCP